MVPESGPRALREHESNAAQGDRHEQYIRAGYDWMIDRKRQVREHFTRTYLATGGGMSCGRTQEERPQALNVLENEYFQAMGDGLGRSFQAALDLAGQ